MDKFVGSSEKNLREIFDNPPPIYDTFRIGEADNGEAISKAALHIIGKSQFACLLIACALGYFGISQTIALPIHHQFWTSSTPLPEREEEMAEKRVVKGTLEWPVTVW